MKENKINLNSDKTKEMLLDNKPWGPRFILFWMGCTLPETVGLGMFLYLQLSLIADSNVVKGALAHD